MEFEISLYFYRALNLYFYRALKKQERCFETVRLRDKPPLRDVSEVLLPFANLARHALHVRLENRVGDAGQKLQGGGHWRARYRSWSLDNLVGNYNRIPPPEVTIVTRIHVPYKILILL